MDFLSHLPMFFSCLLVPLVMGLPTGQQGYGYSSSYPVGGQSGYSSYPAYQSSGYQSAYPAYPQTYQQPSYSYGQQGYQQVQPYSSTQQGYSSFQPAGSWSYPAYQAPDTYSYPAPAYSGQSYQAPVYNYMINELPMNYFGPASSPSSSSSSSSSSAVVSSISPSNPAQRPAWQGKIDGAGRTRCHDGEVLPFRARCNQVVECTAGEDEYDCDWHKSSTIPTINNVEQFKSVLAANEKVLVEFFAPWCPACVTFLPELEKLSARTTDIPLVIYKVNTDDNPELKEMFSVDTFPRVLMFNKRTGTEPRTYHKSNGLKFEPLHSWVRQQL